MIFAAHAGLWGVLVIDMIQFFIKMSAVIAAAYFAVKAPEVGGLAALIDKLSALAAPASSTTRHPARLHATTGTWRWRSSSCRWRCSGGRCGIRAPSPAAAATSRSGCWRRSRSATRWARVLFFNVAHYVLRPWPWILVALASLIVYPELSDIQRAFPNLDPSLLGHDIAYPAMLKFLPVGFIGLMVGGLIAANSSTILTHLNWGASYLVHDFYRRFIRRDAERAALRAGRPADDRRLVRVCGRHGLPARYARSRRSTSSCRSAPAPGLLYLVRWFWWRVNAASEVVAMTSSFLVSAGLLVLARRGTEFTTSQALLITVVITTVCWIGAAYLGPQTDRDVLREFYRKVRPFGPGWARIRAEVGAVAAGRGRGKHSARAAGVAGRAAR